MFSGNSTLRERHILEAVGNAWLEVLRKQRIILGTRLLTLPLLTLTICLVEQTLNARPLTPVSVDPSDKGALRPNHFLLGPKVLAQPLLPDASRHVECRKMYKVAKSYIETIRQRWIKGICHNAMYEPNWIEQRNIWNLEIQFG